MGAMLFALLSPPSGATQDMLPGASVTFREALGADHLFAAVCAAVDSANLDAQGTLAKQDFAIREGFRSTVRARRVELVYRLHHGERPVRRGERVIWIVRAGDDGVLWGVKCARSIPPVTRRLQAAFNEWDKSFRVHIEGPHRALALGEPVSITWQLYNPTDARTTLWSAADGHLDIFQNGPPGRRHMLPLQAMQQSTPLTFKTWSPHDTLAIDQIQGWLDAEGKGIFDLRWRGQLRIGAQSAQTVPVRSNTIILAICDPASLRFGAESDELSLGMDFDRHELPQNEWLEVTAAFVHHATGAGRHVNAFDRRDAVQWTTFVFTNKETGAVFERRPFVFQFPSSCSSDDISFLAASPVVMCSMRIQLVSASTRIPPGHYTVVATYSGEHATVSERCWSYDEPPVLWRGRVESAPISLTVGSPEYDAVELWVGSHYEYREGRWIASQEAPIVVQARIRPGYLIGMRFTNFVVGPHGRARQVSRGVSGGPSMFPPAHFGPRASDKDSVVSEVTLFETSNHQIHLWQPESGDYRVLWEGRIEGRR
jgi:hypothetical protein